MNAHELAFARLQAQEFVRANSNVTKIAEIIIRKQIHQKEQQMRDVQFMVFLIIALYVNCYILCVILRALRALYHYYFKRRK